MVHMLVQSATSAPLLLKAFLFQTAKPADAKLRYCSGISLVVAKKNHVNFSSDSRCPEYQADAEVNVGQNRVAAMSGHHLRLWA